MNERPTFTPVEAAVDAGIFGVETNGSIRPTPDGIEAMAEEQMQELWACMADLRANGELSAKAEAGIDPRNEGDKPFRKPEWRLRFLRSLEDERRVLRNQISGCIEAWRNGFGEAGARALVLWAKRELADVEREDREYETDEETERSDLERAVWDATHGFANAQDRWAKDRATGLTDDELRERLGFELGIAGGSNTQEHKGGKNPTIWVGGFSVGEPDSRVKLSGRELLKQVRRVLEVGLPDSPVRDGPRTMEQLTLF